MMELQKRTGVWNFILISIAIATIAYFVIFKCFSIVYAINDDVAMRDIASGAMTGKPDGHLIFIKYALGFLISGMYRMFPGIDWYGLLMSGLIMICLAIVLYRGLSDIQAEKNQFLYVLLVVFLFLCTGLQHVVIFQWTVTAGIVGATGVFLLYTSPEQDRLRSNIEEMVAASLLILAFCIRDMVLLMLLPAAGICYLFKYVRIDRGKRRFFIRHAWFWPFVLFGCIIVMLIETSAYQGEEWKDYKEFNAYRAQYYDYALAPSFRENQDFYVSIDMKAEEVKALNNYSLFLVDGIYEYKLGEIVNYARNRDDSRKGIPVRLVKGVQGVYEDFEASTYAPLSWILAFVTAVAAIVFWRRRSSQFYLLFVCMGIQLALWCYLGFQGRIVSRVSFAMHLYMLFLMGAFLYRELLGCRVEWIKSCVGGGKTHGRMLWSFVPFDSDFGME